MQTVIVDLTKLRFNINKAADLCKESGIIPSVMIKNFYTALWIGVEASITGVKVWATSIQDSFNYIIGRSDPDTHSGGIVVDLDEVISLSAQCLSRSGNPFKVYIPINAGDGREGLSVETAIALRKASEIYEGSGFKVRGAVITSGCINGNAPTPEELRALIVRLRSNGFDYISVGGSYYLGKLFDGDLEDIGIDEIRFGEYAIYGTTTPYHETPEDFRGYSSVTVEAPIAAVYEDRNEVLVMIGQTSVDTDKSTLLTEGFKFKACSTEYTILEYSGQVPNIGDKVTLVPDYHSLIKLFTQAPDKEIKYVG